ncbi:DUF4197 domain-containing protein [Erythrobacter sp. EC-HK427]|uniref:DUF4197 domain-containing protein n=1 Tax=Erythrobacter sp. EC-HK427 TaxID=2038396 RepID=UPI0012561336|nr:DUF4197 domain-containing protein [Erythrobacter sp. EC-HK427]VVT19174.1 conserved hypothetical protein [Erythrobacter sp. EC-HK427]
MTEFTATTANRRRFLAGAGATGALLVLPGCESMGGLSLTEAVRRLLELSSQRAFDRMLQPGGYWDEQVAAIGLNSFLGVRGNAVANFLTSTAFRNRLEDVFAAIALEGSEIAAPIVLETVRGIGINNALAIVNGGPTAAMEFLRGEMGMTLVELIVPEVGTAIRIANEPVVRDLLASTTGVDVGGISQNMATRIDNAIWREMGVEEAAIRANPRATNDPLLIGVLGARNL